MPVLIDAYNLIHVTGVLPPHIAGPDLDGLIALLTASRHRYAAITLFCDGDPPLHVGGRLDPPPNVRLRFSGPGRTADDLMIDAIRRSDAPRSTTVVTSDREIRRVARRRRCPVLRSEIFMRQLATDHAAGIAERVRPDKPAGATKDLTPEQVDRWIRRFGLTDSDLVIPPEQPPAEPIDPVKPAPDSSSPSMPVEPTEPPQAADAIPDDVLQEAERLAAFESPPDVPPPNDRPAPPPAAEKPTFVTPDRKRGSAHKAIRSDNQPFFPPDLLDEADRMAEDD